MKTVLPVLLALLVATAFVRPYEITDISMNYTLVEGDYAVVENISAGIHVPSWGFFIDSHIYSRPEGIGRGDLLAFRHPMERRLYLKRCVALPKDRLFLGDKNLYLQIESDSKATCRYAKKYGIETFFDEDGCWLKNPYEKFYDITHIDGVRGPKELIDYPKTVIPEKSYFFMGDFRDNSTDSRFFGPVPYDMIYYRVWFVIKKSRSLESLGSIKNL
ncbi:signal peptidase I [Hydrogenimonas sp.]|nr:signal peptidase I [Hydrogenimonas sp.]